MGGARGELGGDWSWEAAANWGRTTGVDGMTNIANLERVANSINPARFDDGIDFHQDRIDRTRDSSQRETSTVVYTTFQCV